VSDSRNYYLIQPAKFRLDGGAMFGIIPKPLWERGAPADEYNRIDMALRMLVIQEANRLLVVDCGIGDYHPAKFKQRFDIRGEPSPVATALKEIDQTPNDVTDLVISHLHFDHVGGIVQPAPQGDQWVPIFPNATCHLHREHYQYATNNFGRDSGSFHGDKFMPAINHYLKRDQINWLEGKSGTIIDSPLSSPINFTTSMGHTPFMVHLYDSKVVYLADLIPTSCHIPTPWVMGYDMMPGESCKEKLLVLEFANQRGLTLFFEHDPIYWGGTAAPHPEKKSEFVFDQKHLAPDGHILPLQL
jgi:glyoxylase-like metal-dependent hydrolase (beta-lactamase superfamily II)